MTIRLRKIEGFTLMEILIAIGLFALAVSGLLVLFPVAHRTDREGTEEMRSALIAGSIMDSLSLTPSNGMVALANGVTNEVPVWKFLDPKTTTNQAVAYTSTCDPLCELGETETAQPVLNPQAVAIATLHLSKKPSLPCLIMAEVEVSSPAAAPPENRTKRRFVKLIPDIPHGCDPAKH